MTRALPHLRVRSGYSFKRAFGPVKRLAETMARDGVTAAAMVDGNTWGHVRWQKELSAAKIKPLFGIEVAVKSADNGAAPMTWTLAKDTRALYSFATAALKEEADVRALLGEAPKGLIRFAGAALSDPDQFDYVDINPGSLLSIRRALALHKKTRKPLVITSDNNYPAPGDRSIYIAMGGRERTTPQHLLTIGELPALFPMLTKAQITKAVDNAFMIADQCASELPKTPLIEVAGDLRAVVEAGRKRRLKLGHIAKWTKDYAARLDRELKVIEEKKYQSYFLVVSDLVTWAKRHMLVGPGRGSSSGSLLCYLVGITEVDPLTHGLLFERFIDLTRSDLPDIDIDFSDKKRDMVFDYLIEKYGRDNVARLGNVNRFAPKSAMHEICKRFDIFDHDKYPVFDALIPHEPGDERYGKSLEDTFNNTPAGKAFVEKHPAARIVTEFENHPSHTGVHAAGVIVSNVAITDYCTVGPDGIAQIDKPDAEALNLLKIDVLGLKTLGVIEDAGVVTSEELYALKYDDPAVFKVFNDRRLGSVFQFEGATQRDISRQVRIEHFVDIDHITALSRPGPLGGGASAKYIRRKLGEDIFRSAHPKMIELLKETFGVVLYQEQVMNIVRTIGRFSWEETTTIRKAIGQRKGKEAFGKQIDTFIAGAKLDGIDASTALAIWNELVSFGTYGMNKSHTCAYAMISYWCAYMKVHYPLEFAAACLRGAAERGGEDQDSRVLEVLREVVLEGIDYEPFNIDLSQSNWAVIDGKLIGGFQNLKGVGAAKATKALEDRATGKLDREKFLAMDCKFKDLYPLRARFKPYYTDPESQGCSPGSEVLMSNQFPEEGVILHIGTVFEKKTGDLNEEARVAKRGRALKGQTLFIDLMVKDDLGMPIRCRFDKGAFDSFGKAAAALEDEKDVILVKGKKLKGIPMISCWNVRCLTKPDHFTEIAR